MLPQQYCLRWKYHHSNLQTMFSQLLDRGCFCDVTLACEGQLIRAHRVVLCACSTFFDTVLTNYASERDPIIIIKDVSYADVKCLIEFMYKGEINVEHTSLASLLKTADDLKIKGLAEVSWRDDETDPMMVADSRLQENIPHNDQKTSSGNHYDGRMSPPMTHIGPNSRASRLPILAPMPMPSSNVGEYVGPKRKRGRPPLDDSYDVFSTPKATHIPPNCDMMYPEVRAQLNSPPNVEQRHPPRDTEEPVRASPEPAEWPQPNIEHRTDVPSEGNNSPNPIDTIPSAVAEYYQNNDSQEPPNHSEEITCEQERKFSIDQDTNDLIGDDNDHEHDPDQEHDHEQNASKSDDCDPGEANLTTEELAQYGDVVKMDAYLAKGRRPQFWEEPFTRRILDAIKNKKLEMKKAAKVLGVSYGTLYGRYREVYGCLKHPYRVTTTPMSRYEFNWNPKRPGKLKSEGFKRRLAAVKLN